MKTTFFQSYEERLDAILGHRFYCKVCNMVIDGDPSLEIVEGSMEFACPGCQPQALAARRPSAAVLHLVRKETPPLFPQEQEENGWEGMAIA